MVVVSFPQTAVTQTFSVKRMFLEISQISKENISEGASFLIKLQILAGN